VRRVAVLTIVLAAALTRGALAQCEGFCGGQSPQGCYCDELCFYFADCCVDVCDQCCDLSNCVCTDGCKGYCGGQAPANCYCDELCFFFTDCCDDVYEHCNFEQCPAEPTPGDMNGDGVVDMSDLLMLLGQWGNCPAGQSCPGDLNDDGAVDVLDLLVLLGNWG
jgi:hypothetical protein